MKVALCFSGQPRNIHSGFNHINTNILEPNRARGHEIDVFAHVWYSREDINKEYINSSGQVASTNIGEDVPSVISRLYDPKKITYEKLNKFEWCNDGRYNNKFSGIVPGNSMSQRWSTYEAFKIPFVYETEPKINIYDAMIRLRFDWGIHNTFLFNEQPMNAVTFTDDCPHGGLNDQFAFGPTKLMIVYSELYWYMHTIYEQGCPFVDELMLRRYCEMKEIPINISSIPYTLLRR